jgi:hypothetical protein
MFCQYPLFAGQLVLDVSAGPEFQYYSSKYSWNYANPNSDTVFTDVLEDYSQKNISGYIGITPGYMVNDRLKLSLAIEHRFQKPITTWKMQSFIAPRITFFAPYKEPISISVDFGYCAWYNTVKNDLFLPCDYESFGYSISIDYYLRRYLALSCVVHHSIYNKIQPRSDYQSVFTYMLETQHIRKEAVSVGLRLSYNVLHFMKNKTSSKQ